MIVTKVVGRGTLFTFSELEEPPYECPTNVYAIAGRENFYILDSYLGPSYMREIKGCLEKEYGKKAYILFNSHSHWDHIWSNSEFRDSPIIGHEECRELILSEGAHELAAESPQFAREEIELLAPNLVFSERLIYPEEGITFFHSPGHSLDSASCYDSLDKVLFTGDNIDDPIPSYLYSPDLDRYIATLTAYLDLDISIVVQSHGPPTTRETIEKNIDYLKKLRAGERMSLENDDIRKKHNYNVEFLKREREG